VKLTWFGGATVRIHIGGSILVADPAGISGVDPDELVSGADQVFATSQLEPVDAAKWQPARAGTMLDVVAPVQVFGMPGGAIVSAQGEAPLLLVSGEPERVGRWGRDAIVVVFGEEADALAASVLEQIGPQLIAVAAAEGVVDRAFAALRSRLDGTGLTSLEAGMALEV